MSYSITGGDPGEQFSVGESTGVVRVREALDREAASSYNLVSTVQYSTVQKSTVQEHWDGENVQKGSYMNINCVVYWNLLAPQFVTHGQNQLLDGRDAH